MNFFNKQREKIPTNKLPRMFSLYIRIICAGYLLYTADSLVKNNSIAEAETEGLRMFFLIAVIMFTIIGVIMFSVSIYSLAIGKYEGGKLDAGYSEDEIQDANIVSEVEIKNDTIEEKSIDNDTENDA